MRIVKSDLIQPAWRGARHAGARTARIERLGLVATSAVLLLGIWLTYVGQVGAVRGTPADIAAGRVVDLSVLDDASALAPALQMFGESAERHAVAVAIYQHVEQAREGSSLQHVGILSAVTMPSAQVRRDPRLTVMNQRLRTEPTREALRVLSAADIASLKPSVVVRGPAQYRSRIVAAVAVFMISFWLAHLVRWRFGVTGDALLLPVVHLLTGLGLMANIALRDPLRETVAATAIAHGIAAGCAIWTALAFVDFENPRLRRAVLPPLLLAVLTATALLIFGSGPTGSGARVNLLGVQPAEIIRLLVVFSLAAYFARRWQFLRELSGSVVAALWVGRWFRPPRWKDLRPLVVSIGALLALFFLQKDLGPALVLSCVFLGLYGISRARVALVACGFALLSSGFVAGYVLGVPATVTRRVAIAMDPWDNALAGGDQLAHAFWAMSSGGPWGGGLGVGDPQFIPAGHTDLVIAALGEELGYIGFLVVVALFTILVWRLLRISLHAPGDYTSLLTLGMTLAIAVQGLVIVAGVLGLLPLAGVVTPFLSYGRSSMLCNFAAVAVCAAVGLRVGTKRIAFAAPVRALGWTLACATAIVVCRAGYVQVVAADTIATRGNLTQQADGGLRYQYNPRLVAAARQITRGSIYDRTGLPLATSRPDELAAFAERYRKIGVTLPADCLSSSARCYPFGGHAFHVLGQWPQQTNWAARNASYIERDFDAHLKGFDDRPTVVDVLDPRTGRTHSAVQRDYRELLPLVRHKGNPGHVEVRQVLARDRNLHATLDAELQLKTAQSLQTHARRAESGRGAAVVLDPATGELLASASYPWPSPADLAGETTITPERLLDRARYGLYPPGSTFKLVTAVAALRADAAAKQSAFQCVRLPDGRVGGRVRGASRPIRDDPLDHVPHGRVDLHRGLVVSCNAYFSYLGQRVGAAALLDAASAAQIATSAPPGADELRRTLPYASYGQGHVVASPLRMARVTAALASGGVLRDVRVTAAADRVAPGARWVSTQGAALLRVYMREVVTTGTGRVLARHPQAVAGKTGTAEVDDARSHSWFVGFAPYLGQRPIAFAVIVENAGYGARVAGPLAGDIVSVAHSRGLIK